MESSTSTSGLHGDYVVPQDERQFHDGEVPAGHGPGVVGSNSNVGSSAAAKLGVTPGSVIGEEGGMASGKSGRQLPKILLMGLRRSGKSSIQKVVFHKMSPNGTLFLETTNQIVKEDVVNSSFVQFSIWDFPGQIDFFDAQLESENIFDQCGAIVFVIDSQDDLTEALNKLHQTVLKAFSVKPDIKFEVFIHKVDGLSDDTKMESQREICSRSQEDLQESGLEGRVQLSYYLTSIYDHSIFEAFSKVVQKLIRELPYMEQMLDTFVSRSHIDKVFLFDVVSKIYVATDSSPVEMQSYELCCDMIDVVIDVSSIYGLSEDPNYELAFDNQSASIIELANGSVLYLYEVCKILALVCIVRKEKYDAAKGIIAYNFSTIKSGLQRIFEHRKSKSNALVDGSPFDPIAASSE